MLILRPNKIDMVRIKEIPRLDRPREKIEKYGPEKLSNAELLAVILGNGTKGVNVLELSKKITRTFPKRELAEACYVDLKKSFGLGPAKACQIVACFELGRRLLKDKKSELILSPKDVWENLRDIRDNKKEQIEIKVDDRNKNLGFSTAQQMINKFLTYDRIVTKKVKCLKYTKIELVEKLNLTSKSLDKLKLPYFYRSMASRITLPLVRLYCATGWVEDECKIK